MSEYINSKDDSIRYDGDDRSIAVSSELKAKGNDSFRRGNFLDAISLFSQAIEIDPDNEVLYCNRSMSYSAIGEFENSVLDARRAIDKRPSEAYVKAYYYLVKGLIQLNMLQDAKNSLLSAFNRCGPKKELISLEEDLIQKFGGHPLRPKPNDFEILEELGDGNFSKIFKAKYKKTGYVYSIKTIEKQTAERMKRRHPNINNEILMEKRVLSKLDHPSIVILYATFQDPYTLYFQMEMCAGGELWSYMKDNNNGLPASVGCHESLVQFFMAEAINALEFMHRRGIVHRDIKPENILLSSSGHLKFVDFGTAKDLLQTDLNGPEFVGTAEYMSPYTVRSRPVGIEADLWSLGIMFFQLLTGYTPFVAPSPYLSFLRIQRGILRIPEFVSSSTKDLIVKLLYTDGFKRLYEACGVDLSISDQPKQDGKKIYPVSRMTPEFLANVNYDKIRRHQYFDGLIRESSDYENDFRMIHKMPSRKVPTLRDICIRAVGRAATKAADLIAKNGGVRPPIKWVQNFHLTRLSSRDKNCISHYLDRCDLLNPVNGVYRLFCDDSIETRTIKSNLQTKEYLGHYYSHHGQFHKEFGFVFLSNTLLTVTDSNSSQQEKNLKSAISGINKCRPKFVIFGGNFTESSFNTPGHDQNVQAFRKMASRISETIPILFVPGSNDVGEQPTSESLLSYNKNFGADYYGFWYNGTRILVINSPLLCRPELAESEARLQHSWFEEEIEQAKLCASHLIICSHHPWFINRGDEEDSDGVIPRSIRLVWLKKLRHNKVKFLISSFKTNTIGKAFIRSIDQRKEVDLSSGYGNEGDEDFPKQKDVIKHDEKYRIDSTTGEPLKPSELLAGDSLSDNDDDKEEIEKNEDKKIADSDDEKEFENEHNDYFGLFSVSTGPIGDDSIGGLRVFRVYEDDMKQQLYSLSDFPQTIIL